MPTRKKDGWKKKTKDKEKRKSRKGLPENGVLFEGTTKRILVCGKKPRTGGKGKRWRAGEPEEGDQL